MTERRTTRRAFGRLLIAVTLVCAAAVAAASSSSASAGTLSAQVVGGTEARISDAPWQVALLHRGRSTDYSAQFCGGSLISSSWVVTAAHCVTEDDLSVTAAASIDVLFGSDWLARFKYTGRTVDRVIRHPAYDDDATTNDIALLHLAAPASGRNVATIALPSRKYVGYDGLVTGWGSTARVAPDDEITDPIWPNRLQKGTVRTRYDVVCRDSSIGSYYDGATMLCAGTAPSAPATNYPVDTCQGDSGGPLAVRVRGVWVLAGVTSWGDGCGWTTPGVYTNVARYVGWIRGFVPTARVG